MDFADDLVINDPLKFCYFLEGEFAANIFRFGSHYCFLVSLSLVCSDFSKLGWLGHVESWIEFSVFVDIDFFNFVWLGRVGDWLELAVLVFFFGLWHRGLVQICRAVGILQFI